MWGDRCVPGRQQPSQAVPDPLKEAGCPSFQDSVIRGTCPGPALSSPDPQGGQRLPGGWARRGLMGRAVLVAGTLELTRRSFAPTFPGPWQLPRPRHSVATKREQGSHCS